jgi:hypothetical protein
MAKQENQNAWVAVDHRVAADPKLARYMLVLQGGRSLYQTIAEYDWVLIQNAFGVISRVGRVMRVRSDLETTTLYFDHLMVADSSTASPISKPSAGSIGRIQWSDFVDSLQKMVHKTVDEIPLIEDHSYIRELLQLAVMDDLLGPAGGPHEQIIDMGVRDRYLVGKLAPMETVRGGIEGLEGPLVNEEAEIPEESSPDRDKDAPRKLSHEPGAEFNSASGKVDPEADASDEINAASNQSLVPSSFGITFCVDGNVESIEVEARWGRYVRDYDQEIFKTKKNKKSGKEEQIKAKVWQRIPCGGKIVLDMKEGPVPHRAPDREAPEVRVQGTVRGKNENGDRLVTLFLVNAQEELDENKDGAWVFQPELILRAKDGSAKKAIFRRRPVFRGDRADEEREALEMIYRRHVEFAVGHGISVHAETADDDVELATEVRTVVLPQAEVPVTEAPGLAPEDRHAMREMVGKGHLDMQSLADMSCEELVAVLTTLANDYAAWIDEQRARIGKDVKGHDTQVGAALERCKTVQVRLLEGIDVLSKNEKALAAFRFANRAMALQRIHSMYALARRRGEQKELTDFEKRENRSWRPFQLAFILLSIPSLADPNHRDRTQPVEAYADLLWFPTGGGKTEAYLGVAAFTMVIRRLQGKLGGLDGSRGLAVIMRYTLRLLTLQQFQRGSVLICAMEILRHEALKNGDESLGMEPFIIGLWVGNKVTPGTTKASHKAIEDTRNPERRNPTSTPAQITSCPWCGNKVSAGQDIDVNRAMKRTTIYCGDRHCEFSKGQSSKQAHPGLPVLVIDEEIYHRPPSMMIATVDKFAMMAWRGEARTFFGRVSEECPRHGLLWADADCKGRHPADNRNGMPATTVRKVMPIRPPDLIIQDEFHLISGPLGTMVGLYETVVDQLSTWELDGKAIRPKIIASTATVRKAKEQVNNVFMRRVSIFPPHGLDIEDNFFSVQRSIDEKPGRRYIGVCSPGSSRPAMLIRVYTAFLTAAKALFDRFGQAADPYMTTVGYFNSLRELGGMKRLAEDDVQTRSYRVEMSLVKRPGLAQRSCSNIKELTSRVSNQDIPKYLDQLEVKFKAEYDAVEGKYVTHWDKGEDRAIDVVLATNMLSVGVDINRIGLMAVNGQPKGTAEYIQATSRVGRSYPGLVCTVLTWARPRDLSHYETFEHYHSTFYKHVEAQSVTPFSPRAMDRGLTGALISVMRLQNDIFNPNEGAHELDRTDRDEVKEAIDVIAKRAWNVNGTIAKDMAVGELKERVDEWAKEASRGGRNLAYEKKGEARATTVALIKSPGIMAWDNFTVPMSMREVEPGVRLVMSTNRLREAPDWAPKPVAEDKTGSES